MQNIPQFVVKWLQRTVEVGPHPDADVLTAFAEQSLAGAERSLVVEHLARCGDCRDVVGMALPEAEIVVHSVPARGFGIGWLSWPALRWGAVAAGVLAIASYGVLELEYEHGSRKTIAASSTVQDSVVVPNVAVASKLPAAAPTTQAARAEGRKKLVSAGESGLAKFASGRSSSARSVMVGADAADGRDQIAENHVDLPMNRPALDLDIVKAKNPVPLEMEGAQWAVAGGELERSFDQGKTWEKVDPIAAPESAAAENGASGESLQEAASVPGAKLVFRCVTAAGLEVWAGGSAGVFFHSADGGASWTRVAPSMNGMRLMAEIAGIQFSDPQHGVVTTSTGELWATADAGQTWHKQ